MKKISGKKGFVLTMDAAMAVAIAFTASFAIIAMLSSAGARFDAQQLARAGNDILSALYHNGTLNSYIGASEVAANSDIANKLAILPLHFCGNLTVMIYDADNFANKNQYGAATCVWGGNDVFRARRIFADYNKKKFGIAEVAIWLR